MSGARITIDGLWRCLCPSIDAATFNRAISTPYHPRLPSDSARRRRRRLHTTTSRLEDDAPRDNKDGKDGVHPRRLVAEDYAKSTYKYPHGFAWKMSPRSTDSNRPVDESFEQLWSVIETAGSPDDDAAATASETREPPPSSSSPNNTARTRTASTASTPKPPLRPDERPTINKAVLSEILKARRDPSKMPKNATFEEIQEVIRYTRDLQKNEYRILTAYLIKHLLDMGFQPNTFLYETLLMAHASTQGSADSVKSVLEEMRRKKIPWSSTLYQSALRALVIHPSYLVRSDVLRQMKERWIEVTRQGHQWIALGLLRDEQYELALEKLEEMVLQNQRVDSWVFDIFIYVFGKLEFLDDALRIARHRLDAGHEVNVNVWYFLLDECSKGHSHDATAYIWHRTVESDMVNPSDGVCLNVINMAAAYGNADLATHVLQFLADRGTKLGQAHYEAVADAYCIAGNIEKAIEAFCIMNEARIEINNASMGTFSQTLERDPSLVDVAINALSTVREKQPISIYVFNAILNQLVKRSDITDPKNDNDTVDLPQNNPENTNITVSSGYSKALDFYRNIRKFVPSGPNVETFRYLLWKCADPDIAQFLAKEMAWFGLRQSRIVMEQIFRVQVEHNGPDHRAKRYFYRIAPSYHMTTTEEGETKGDDGDGDKTGGGTNIQKSTKWRRFMELSVKLVKRLIRTRDPEAWRILTYCQANGLEKETVNKLKEAVENGEIEIEEEEEEQEEVETERSSEEKLDIDEDEDADDEEMDNTKEGKDDMPNEVDVDVDETERWRSKNDGKRDPSKGWK